jgi:hypothetical protein
VSNGRCGEGGAEDRPGRGDALFLPAWSRWPLTVTAGRCVLAVMLPTFEDHEVTHQARRPWRRIDHVARKAERSSALADEHTDDISVDPSVGRYSRRMIRTSRRAASSTHSIDEISQADGSL